MAPCSVVISTSCSLAMAALHLIASHQCACGVFGTSLSGSARPLTAPPVLWLTCLPQGSRVDLSPARRGAHRPCPRGLGLVPHASHCRHALGAAHDEKSRDGAADCPGARV